MPENILRWTHSFLTERQHRVKIGATLSDWAFPNGGVPQLAGPLHYQLMSNDFVTCLDMLKYVDDSTNYEVTRKD